MERNHKRIFVIVVIVLIVSLSLNIIHAAGKGDLPGTEGDPIVSKSYVDEAISKLAAKVQELIEQSELLKEQNTKLTEKVEGQAQAIKTLQESVNVTGGTGSGGSASTSIGKGAVNVAVLNLRKEPNTNSAILGKLNKNEEVSLISKSGDWYKVTTSKGTNGFVFASYVTVKK